MSIGAVAENLMLRAARLGLELRPDWHLGRTSASLFVEFNCHEAAPVTDGIEQAIESRHTNRRLRFVGPPLDAVAQSRLSAEASIVGGTAVVWLDDSTKRSRALRVIRLAESERFRNEFLHRELFESIRFDAGWHASTSEGLPPGALELPPPERLLFSALRSWRVARTARALGMPFLIGLRAADLPCRLAPHLCAIAVEGADASAPVRAGRLLQRVWLRATTLGLACQPFAASPVYALDGSTEVEPNLRRRLAAGWKELCPPGRTPFIVLRMGRAKAPSVRSSRPAPGSVLSEGS
jgi:hypothetical protein